MHPFEQQIVALLNQRRNSRMTRREIADRLDLRGGERKILTKILDQLVRAGQLEERRGQYRIRQETKTLEGIFSQADQGYGFLRSDNEEQEDLFIPARFVDGAMDGDRIVVRYGISSYDRRPFGKVLRVVERAHITVLGTFQKRSGRGMVWPLEKKVQGPIMVGKGKGVSSGSVVEVHIDRYARGDVPAAGKITEILGSADDPQVDIQTVIRSHNLPHEFSPETIQEAGQVAQQVEIAALAGRTDLRDLPFVTIDGETARDFDDAVAVQKQADGCYRLWVCIADVGHYVTPGSALDKDAHERGTSVYFPGFCLPMLPEALSNGICSLNPREDRLVMAAELLIDVNGKTVSSDFYPAVICSQARLTYTEVASTLDDPVHSVLAPELQAQLQQMAVLAQHLTVMRQRRGSLDLDVPEVEIILDENDHPVDLARVERNQAHRLIEEFMLAANEAVAAFISGQDWPLLFRIHETPDLAKLQELQQLASECGVGLVLGKQLHKGLQEMLAEVAERPEGRLLNQQLLRSLQQACYAPDNNGHFGLAAESYCHFTSPIRRYPDLIIHRILKLIVAQAAKQESYSYAALKVLGQECSDAERRAVQAERDLIQLRCCQIMATKVGHLFYGTISSVTEFGFFVELDDTLIDGLVHVRSLQGDYYHYDPLSHTLTGERRRKEFKIGMRVEVVVSEVDPVRRRIDFELLD